MTMKQVPDSDDRVRCWHCAERSAMRSVPIPVHDETGKSTTVYVEQKSCNQGLGFDPLVLRRCRAYRALPAAYREPLPKRP